MRGFALPIVCSVCPIWACVVEADPGEDAPRLSTFAVQVHEANTPDAPIPLPESFSGHTYPVTIDVEARDSAGQPFQLDGRMALSAAPAGVSGPAQVELTDGRATDVPVDLVQPYGRTSIWVVDSLREEATQAVLRQPHAGPAPGHLQRLELPPGVHG